MCGIFGFLSKRSTSNVEAGRKVLTMLEALACRGPDSVGAAVIGPPVVASDDAWLVRIASASTAVVDRAAGVGEVLRVGGDGVAYRRRWDPAIPLSTGERRDGR